MKILYFSFLLIIFHALPPEAAQAQSRSSADSLKREILNLRLEVSRTQNSLQFYSQDFKRGILTSVIGYSIVITGGVLLGTDNLNEWGQPLIFAGGVVGATGGFFLYRSHRHLRDVANPPPLPDRP
jgi:hypothetical protein